MENEITTQKGKSGASIGAGACGEEHVSLKLSLSLHRVAANTGKAE